MKNLLIKTAAFVVLAIGLAACSKDMPVGTDTTTLRISVNPEPGVISADGRTFTSSVVINKGVEFDVDWTVSVDFEPDWISVEKTEVETEFVGTYEGDDRIVTQRAINVSVNPNESVVKRTATLRFTTADGGSIIYVVTQKAGSKL